MALGFPNQSRSYDAQHHRIRFWGHDYALEVPFLLEEDVIFMLYPRTPHGEAGILAAFDAAWDRVTMAARKAFGSKRKPSYILGLSDF